MKTAFQQMLEDAVIIHLHQKNTGIGIAELLIVFLFISCQSPSLRPLLIKKFVKTMRTVVQIENWLRTQKSLLNAYEAQINSLILFY